MAIRNHRAKPILSDEHACPAIKLSHEQDVPMGNSSSRRKSARHRLAKMIAVGMLSIAGLSSTGCMTSGGVFRAAQNTGYCDELIEKYRNRVAAERAWHCNKDRFGIHASNEIFKDGFIEGYLDIAEGGKGCPPPVAPRQYWSWRYQNVGGQNAVGSWFAGFPEGVKAAKADGLASYRIPDECKAQHGMGCGCNSCNDGTQIYGPDGQPMPYGTVPETTYFDENGQRLDPSLFEDDPAIAPMPGMAPIPDNGTNGIAPSIAPTPSMDTEASRSLIVPGANSLLPTGGPVDISLPPTSNTSVSPPTIVGGDALRVSSRPDSNTKVPLGEGNDTSISISDDDSKSIDEIFGLKPSEKATVVESEPADELPFSFE